MGLLRSALLIALALAIGAFLFFSDTEVSTHTPAVEESVDTEPDIYGKDVTFRQLRPDGSLHYRLRASTIRQFDLDQLTRMAQPQLHLLNPEQPPWDIESNHGYIRKRTGPQGQPEDVVFLREKVELVQQHPENGLITMRSESFYIYPDRQYAETDQDVMIDTEVGRTKAAGLRANLESGVLSLSSAQHQRVHTIVLPEQFKNSDA